MFPSWVSYKPTENLVKGRGAPRPLDGAHRLRLLESGACRRPSGRKQEAPMKNPLDSLWGTVISGLVLTAILYYIVRGFLA
jgi:hypothetical protein